MRRAFTSFSITMAMLLASCTYSNSDIYYANPLPGDSATVVISTNLDTLDRVVISDSLLFRYSAGIENGELYFTRASIGSSTLYQYATDYDPDTLMEPFVLADSFWIYTDPVSDEAQYTLLFTAYYSANTNSLGDKLGLEAGILELDFELFVEGGGE